MGKKNAAVAVAAEQENAAAEPAFAPPTQCHGQYTKDSTTFVCQLEPGHDGDHVFTP